MEHKSLNVIITILVLVAVGLGIAIVYQKTAFLSDDGEAGIQSQPTPSELSGEALANEEQTVLNFPAETATESDRRQHSEMVRRLAVASDTLDLTGCRPDPVVLEVLLGETVTVRNSDVESYELVINSEYVFVVPGGGETEVVADFGKGLGVYGYGCEPASQVVGIIHVVSEQQ